MYLHLKLRSSDKEAYCYTGASPYESLGTMKLQFQHRQSDPTLLTLQRELPRVII